MRLPARYLVMRLGKNIDEIVEVQMKCIHFPLPSGAGGMAAAQRLSKTRDQLRKFCNRHGIKSYYATIEGYSYYVWFTDEMFYTLFVLVWDKSTYWRSPEIIEKDMPENCRLITLL